VVHDHSLLSQGGLDAPPAVTFELIADCGDRLDDRGVVRRRESSMPTTLSGSDGRRLRRLEAATVRTNTIKGMGIKARLAALGPDGFQPSRYDHMALAESIFADLMG
jgi:hypothetical protein